MSSERETGDCDQNSADLPLITDSLVFRRPLPRLPRRLSSERPDLRQTSGQAARIRRTRTKSHTRPRHGSRPNTARRRRHHKYLACAFRIVIAPPNKLVAITLATFQRKSRNTVTTLRRKKGSFPRWLSPLSTTDYKNYDNCPNHHHHSETDQQPSLVTISTAKKARNCHHTTAQLCQ